MYTYSRTAQQAEVPQAEVPGSRPPIRRAGACLALCLLPLLACLPLIAQEPEAQPPAPKEEAQPAPAVDDLIADLKSADADKQLAALKEILSQDAREAKLVQPLLDVLANAASRPEARSLALRALSHLKDAKLAPVEKDAVVRAVIEAVKDKDPDVQKTAISAVGPADAGAQPALLGAVQSQDPDIRVMALRRLALVLANQPLPAKGQSLPQTAPPELLKALEDPDADVRAAAAMSFWAAGYKDASAIKPLLKIFEEKADGGALGRANALRALVSLRSSALPADDQKTILDAIVAGLKDPSANVRYYAVWAIERADKALLPAVEALLADTDPRVRARAHEKLYMLRAFEAPARGQIANAPEELLQGLSDAAPRVRAQALRAFWIGGYKDSAATEPLLTVLADKDDDNRLARLDALRALANIRAGDVPDAIKERILTALIAGLKDPYFAVRYQAAKALTASDTQALPALQEAEKDENPLVQSAAKEALQRLSGQK